MEMPGTCTFSTPEEIQLLKRLVVGSVDGPASKRLYTFGVDRFFRWFQAQDPPVQFGRAAVQAYKAHLIESGLSSASTNAYLIAVRRLATEAVESGVLASELGSGINRVKGVRCNGIRIGNWLTAEQAKALIDAPNPGKLAGKRDRALLSVLIGCGLRRRETSGLKLEDIQQRESRWIIVDLKGKGGRVRSIPIPAWAKAAVDVWTQAAGFTSGKVFRPVNKSGRLCGDSMTAQSIFETVKKYAVQIEMKEIAPHDLRRTFAKLAHKGKASVQQIRLSLGHSSTEVTEKYLGIEQDLSDAPCDHLPILG
jgi:integrase